MNLPIYTTRAARWVRKVLGCCLLTIIALTAAYAQPERVVMHPPVTSPPNRIKLPTEPGAVEVAFTDGSNLKLLLRDEKITLVTSHGKLLIAVTDIQRIEFASRVSEEDAKRIDAAVADLGSTEFRRREAASATLLKLREKAYAALVRAAQQKDLEVVRRAQELANQIAAAVPAEHLVVRKNDVIYTADSMIAGRIEGASLKAHTSQFGAVQVKLADMRGLRSQAIEPPPPVLPQHPPPYGFAPFEKQKMAPARVLPK
jgi:hypothetical protein